MDNRIIRMRNKNKEYLAIKDTGNGIFFAQGECGKWEKVSGWTLDTLVAHFQSNGYVIWHKEIKTEVDWLNAIQENFKEGI